MGIKVVKFGGSSLADAAHFAQVRKILLSDPERRFAVVSAPGKRCDGDEKVTDLLYQCYRAVDRGEQDAAEALFAKVTRRYTQIGEELGLTLPLSALLEETFREICRQKSPDFAASRGEYLNALLLADYMGWDFIDVKDVVKFDRQGTFAPEWTNEVLATELEKHHRGVLPGFYGSLPNGEVRTFSRGGSDITGAIVARAARADVYENWTDVSGFLMADPRVVENPRPIDTLTYRELRELSYMGATVLHEDAIFPVHRAGIPILIKNTNAPEDPGTRIVMEPTEASYRMPITGIAGHKDFTLISIEKAMMNSELGFGRRVLQALEDFGVSFEHLPTGIDTMCVIISDRELTMTKSQIVHRIQETCHPDSIEVIGGLALIATVGYGMVRTRGTAAKLFRALSEADVNVRMIDQGSSELNIIVGVDVEDFEKAVRAIYAAFVEP